MVARRRLRPRTVIVPIMTIALAAASAAVADVAYAGAERFQADADVAITDDAYDGSTTSMGSSTINAFIPSGHVVVYVIVELAVNHSTVGDLTVKLRSPAGTLMTFVQQPKGDAASNPCCDDGMGGKGDESGLIATHPIAFYDGYPNDAETIGASLGPDDNVCEDDSRCSFKPNPDVATSPASFAEAFTDEQATGAWTLYIGDSHPSDDGTLEWWAITIRHLRPLVACGTDSFTDVPIDHPFCPEINWMAEEGISGGFDDGTYRPAANVTRQAMSAFLARVTGADEVLANCSMPPFSDVPVDHPFCREIQWMAQADISNGFGDGTYRPAAFVTRQAMSAFMARIAGASPTTCAAPPFPDVPTDHPFCPEIAWMKESGVSTGFGDGTYRPSLNVTRQAMSAFIYRLSVLLP